MNLNVQVWSRERFIAGPSKEYEQLVLKKPEPLDGFQGRVFKGKFGVERLQGV